jgi:alpha-tubulin suppressor-like RCC1 family protein
LPPGLSFVSCFTSGGTCSGPAPGSNGTVTFNLGQLKIQVTQNLTIVTQVTAASGPITNTVTVSSSRLDTDLSNNSASNTVQVVPIGAFDSVKAISSAYFVSFALKQDGSVWGWGRNDFMGALGTGDTSQAFSSRPVPAQGLTGVIAISTGGSHTLALKSDGSVWAWGSNGSGECATAPPYPRVVPNNISALSNIIAVAAGNAHSLALKADGTVWGWGANSSGELGLGTSDGNAHPTPVQIPGLNGVASIWAGTGLSVAVRNDGTVWTWGDNHNGQLGISGGSLSTPTQVSGVNGVTAVASSFNHVIVRKNDGTVMCWGMNSLGQTGSATLGNVNPTPVQVSGLSGVTAVAAGFGFSLALKSDGSVWVWGLNPGNSGQSNVPSMIGGLSGVTSIAAGNSHGLVLLSDGTLRAWGDNSYGQLGDATTLQRSSPVPVTGTLIVSQPIFNPPTGYTSAGPLQVQVSDLTSGAAIHYTVNGPDPTENDPTMVSGGTVSITQNAQLKARAFKSGWLPSLVTTAVYTIAQNPIDSPQTFVRQHYLDFLGRDPDQSGLDFWTNQITTCGGNAQCIEVRRIDVSASFFLSIEFQQTGYLVERFYKVAYGDANGTSTFNGLHPLFVPAVRFDEFRQDSARIDRGVIVLQPGWEALLESNKQAYAQEFVQTARFVAAFPSTKTPTEFVDLLNQNAGNVLSANDRATAIGFFAGAADTSDTTSRARAVRMIAEDQDLYNAEYNRAFVLAEYFGYLRRNPNDPQDSDYTGYDFWLSKLNQFNGNYIQAEMVKAFLSSIEYRQRFGP